MPVQPETVAFRPWTLPGLTRPYLKGHFGSSHPDEADFLFVEEREAKSRRAIPLCEQPC